MPENTGSLRGGRIGLSSKVWGGGLKPRGFTMSASQASRSNTCSAVPPMNGLSGPERDTAPMMSKGGRISAASRSGAAAWKACSSPRSSRANPAAFLVSCPGNNFA